MASIDENPSLNGNTEQVPEHKVLERRLPRVNCAEHIIFVVDICKEEGSTKFQLTEGSQHSAMEFVKRTIKLFLHNKHAINNIHQYGLITLAEKPEWVVDLTKNINKMIQALDSLEEVETPKLCNLTPLFDMIQKKVQFHSVAKDSIIIPPDYIIRTIFVYGRSMCLPQLLDGKASFSSLIANPSFFLDIMYMHENPSEDNKCEGIYDLLCNLDEMGWSYVFEVSRNSTKLHNYFARLLAHPLQRPAQKDTHYILPSVSTEPL